MSCATEKCDDPTCGPCTIYERFPNLRELDRPRKRITRRKSQNEKRLPLRSCRKIIRREFIANGTDRSESRPEPAA